MGTYIIVCLVVVVLVVALGGYLVKRKHKRRTAERERLWKIAQGEVQEDDVQQAQAADEDKLPPRRFRFGFRRGLPRLTKALWADMKAIDVKVDEAFKLWPAVRDANREVERLNSLHYEINRRANNLFEAVKKNPISMDDRAGFEAWCANAISDWKANRESQRTVAESKVRQAHVIVPLWNLQVEVATINSDARDHDLTAVPARVKQTLRMADYAVNTMKTSSLDVNGLVLNWTWRQPVVPRAESEQACRAIFADNVQMLWEAYSCAQEVVHLKAQAKELKKRLDELKKTPTWDEPQKPVEQEVQALLSTSVDWAQSVIACEHELLETLKVMDSAQAHASNALSRIRNLLEKVRCSSTRIYEDGTDWVEPEKPKEEAPTGKRWKTKRAVKVAPEPAEPVDPPRPTTYSMTDEADAMFTVARGLTGIVEEAMKSYREGLPKDDELSGYFPVSNQNEDSESCLKLKAAARKLGFAVAQRNATNQKAEAAKADPKGMVAVDELPNAERDVDAFIGICKKRKEQLNQNRVLKENAQEKVAGLQKNLDDRVRQMHEAAQALWVILHESGVNRRARPAELDALCRAFWVLYERFKQPPPPPQPTSSYSSCASSSCTGTCI